MDPLGDRSRDPLVKLHRNQSRKLSCIRPRHPHGSEYPVRCGYCWACLAQKGLDYQSIAMDGVNRLKPGDYLIFVTMADDFHRWGDVRQDGSPVEPATWKYAEAVDYNYNLKPLITASRLQISEKFFGGRPFPWFFLIEPHQFCTGHCHELIRPDDVPMEVFDPVVVGGKLRSLTLEQVIKDVEVVSELTGELITWGDVQASFIVIPEDGSLQRARGAAQYVTKMLTRFADGPDNPKCWSISSAHGASRQHYIEMAVTADMMLSNTDLPDGITKEATYELESHRLGNPQRPIFKPIGLPKGAQCCESNRLWSPRTLKVCKAERRAKAQELFSSMDLSCNSSEDLRRGAGLNHRNRHHSAGAMESQTPALASAQNLLDACSNKVVNDSTRQSLQDAVNAAIRVWEANGNLTVADDTVAITVVTQTLADVDTSLAGRSAAVIASQAHWQSEQDRAATLQRSFGPSSSSSSSDNRSSGSDLSSSGCRLSGSGSSGCSNRQPSCRSPPGRHASVLARLLSLMESATLAMASAIESAMRKARAARSTVLHRPRRHGLTVSSR